MTDQFMKLPQEQPGKKRQQKPKGRSHGEGSVFERKTGDRNKPFVAQVPLGEGRKRIVGYYATRAEAVAAKNKALLEINQLKRIKNSRQTVKEYLHYWSEHVDRLSIRLSTYVEHCSMLNCHILPALGHILIQKLTARDVQQLISKLQGRLSAGRVRTIHALLHKALKHAVNEDILETNVCDRVTLPRLDTKERPVLSLQQAQQLVQAIRDHQLEALLIVALTTGLRHGELRALKWQDIDFEQQEIHVRHSASEIRGYGTVESEPKSRKSRRTVALHAFVVETLKSHRVAQLEFRLKAGGRWRDLNLVFPSSTGNYFVKNTIYRNFYTILHDAGLPQMHLHDLRHSAATILLAMGVNIKVVQEILGHSNVSLTLKVYGHVLPGMQEEAMKKWGNILGKQQQ